MISLDWIRRKLKKRQQEKKQSRHVESRYIRLHSRLMKLELEQAQQTKKEMMRQAQLNELVDEREHKRREYVV